jgi:hypothetical protein
VQYANDTTVIVTSDEDFSSLSSCLSVYESGQVELDEVTRIIYGKLEESS